MNRHGGECNCPVCPVLLRVRQLIDWGCHQPGFLDLAAARSSALELELRNELHRAGIFPQPIFGAGGCGVPPPFFGPGGAATPPWPAPGPPRPYHPTGVVNSQPAEKRDKPRGEKGVGHSQPATSSQAATPGLSPKANPGEQPEHLRSANQAQPPQRVKEEPGESPSSKKPGIKEVDFSETVEEDSKQRKRSRSRKRKRSKSRHKPRKEHRKSRDHSRKGRKKSSSEAVEETRDLKGENRSPSREALQRKSGFSGERSSGHRGPEPPSYPPPDRKERKEGREHPERGGKGSGLRRQGPGWIGPVPRSDHYRWKRGKNKGVVKRAKQEKYNSQRR